MEVHWKIVVGAVIAAVILIILLTKVHGVKNELAAKLTEAEAAVHRLTGDAKAQKAMLRASGTADAPKQKGSRFA